MKNKNLLGIIENNPELKAIIENNEVLDIDFVVDIDKAEDLKKYLNKDEAYDSVEYSNICFHGGYYEKQEILEEFGFDVEEVYEYGGYEEVNMEADRCQAALTLIEEVENLLEAIKEIEE